jgi:cytochrome c-type biogenesis protein CcmH/NrfG
MQLNKLELIKEFDCAKKYLEEREDLKAAKYLREIIDKDPTNHEAWLYLGIALRRIEEYDDAVKCFEKATELKSYSEEAWGLLTTTLMDQGYIDKAKKAIEKAGRLNPSNDHIQFLRQNLVRIYTKFGPFF